MSALFIIFPLICVLFLNLPFKELGRKMAFGAGIIVALVQMPLAAVALTGLLPEGNITGLDFLNGFTIDTLSAVVLLTIGLIALVSLITGRYSGNRDQFNFINLVLIAIIGMNGVTMVTDLFTLYVFLEVTAAASFVLIALYRGKAGLNGSFKYLVMSALASMFMLAALAFILMDTGNLSFYAVGSYIASLNGTYPYQLITAFILFITGLSIKAGLVPFHGWVPDAYSSAPPAVSVLLAGIVTKVAGVYTIMRITKDIFKSSGNTGNAFIILGLVSIVIGALAAIGQSDFKKMLAYSSISQIGYIILGASLGTTLGFAGALLHFFNHAVLKSLLFVNSAAVEMQTGTRDINKLGGLASRMRITGGTSVVGFLSTAGIPPLSGFWSKLLIIMAAWQAGSYISAAVALLSSVLTLAYFLVLQRKVFFGKIAAGLESVTEGNKGLTGSAIFLSAITLSIGLLFPFVLLFMQSVGLI